MSSTYHILCLSHDPTITIETPDYNRPEQAEAAIHDGIDGHTTCDLAIGRYSYPLVALGCPRSTDQPANLRCTHGNTQWTDSNWLRLLAAAYQSDDPNIQQTIQANYHGCLPWERLKRLRTELDITIKPPAQQCCGTPTTCDYCTQCVDFQARHSGDRSCPISRA